MLKLVLKTASRPMRKERKKPLTLDNTKGFGLGECGWRATTSSVRCVEE